ncbi:MAG TPA: PQQ-dependent sugar dehydrogenase [Anaerolineales bacterium]|nr:PQQ-dependent sugar dehydrogenase [Anaerolineales bacterium]
MNAFSGNVIRLLARIILTGLLLSVLAACASTNSTPGAPTQAPAPSDTPLPPPSPAPTSAPQPTATATTAPTDNATSFPDGAAYKWTPVASGVTQPTDIQFPDDGSGRMFVVEQPGQILVFNGGQQMGTVFLDISGEVGSAGSEQGLLGLAFHPDFKSNPYFYVNYTDQQGNTVIARFQADGDQADPASEKDLLHVDQPFPNHNGGSMAFGPDGYLYMGLGDGGSQGDPHGNGQNTKALLGKLLRADVDKGDPYAIPPDNPFAQGDGRPEVWAYGLRNPWRVSFDRLTHDLYIADVGQDRYEEVDFLPAGSPGGSNFGWNYREGDHAYAQAQPPPGLTFVNPVTEYSHQEGGCSITGGYVYRGRMPEWQGIYLFGDYCSGQVRGLMRSGGGWASQLLFQTAAHITTFGQDPEGEIYLAGGGTIYELQK